ncbi:MAG: DNA translocase FtsK [Caldilineaceae bacterium]|nr:DNA translocase FtsK [Caldilineaceae bacterium]
MQMREEAFLMDAIFAEHGLDCRVLPPPASYPTSAMRVYRLHRGTGVKVDRVISLAAELDEALTAARRTPIQCRFDRLPLSIEVPRPDPKPLRLADLLQRMDAKALTANGRLLTVAGEGHSFGRPDPMLLNLASANAPHVLAAGTTGSGKTNLLASMVLSLAALHSPQRLALVILDPKGVDLVTLAGLPHLATPIITDPVEAVGVLAQVVAELERRKQLGVPISGDDLRVVVVIDELAELADVAGKQVEAHIKRILQVGRGLGVHVIGATQKPLASEIGSVVKANFPVRLVGKVASGDDARVAAGISGTGAERLPGQGAFLLLQGGLIHRIQAYFLEPNEIPHRVQRIAQRWANVPLTFQLPSVGEGVQRTIAIDPPAQPASYPLWLREEVDRYLGEHGRLPSQRAVQRAYQAETGQMLGWEAIRRLLTDLSERVPS